MGTKKQKTKTSAIDAERLKQLTRDYFWEQKGEEFGKVLLILVGLGVLIALSFITGLIMQGNSSICGTIFASQTAKTDFNNCMNMSLSFWDSFWLGVIGVAVIAAGVLLIIVIFSGIYEFLNNNLDKATQRAIDTLANEKLNTKGQKHK